MMMMMIALRHGARLLTPKIYWRKRNEKKWRYKRYGGAYSYNR